MLLPKKAAYRRWLLVIAFTSVDLVVYQIEIDWLGLTRFSEGHGDTETWGHGDNFTRSFHITPSSRLICCLCADLHLIIRLTQHQESYHTASMP